MKYLAIMMMVAFSCGNIMAATKNAKASKSTLRSEYIKALGFGGQKATKKSSGVWTLGNGVTIYSTEAYGSKIRGYVGPTPLYIAVSGKGKIVSMVAAPNMETPEYFDLVLKNDLMTKWNGKTLQEAATFKPDAVTGATYSSYAVIRTVNTTAKQLAGKK